MSLAADFARDGAVVIRGALSPELVETLRAGIDANLSAPSANAKAAARSSTT